MSSHKVSQYESEMIAAYIRKELSKEQMAEWQSKIAQDVNLQREIKLQELENKVGEAIFTDKLREKVKQLEFKRKHKTKQHRLYRRVSGIAALILLIILTVVYGTRIKSPAEQNIETIQAYHQDPDFTPSMGINPFENNEILKKAKDAFNREKYNEAISILDKLTTTTAEEKYQMTQLLANSYFEAKEFKKAIPFFEQLTMDERQLVKETAEWNLLLCYLIQSSAYEDAYQILSKDIKNTTPKHIYYNTLIELEQKLQIQ